MNIYYTAYLINNWKTIFQQHLHLLKDSGLLTEAVHMFIFAYPNNVSNEMYELIKDEKKIILYERQNNFEIPALFSLSQTTQDFNIYFHTKGVSQFNKPFYPAVQSWNEYMSYFVITKWRECIQELKNGAGAVGVDFKLEPKPHYSGNFWWTTKQHVQKIQKTPVNRFDCEWHIGSVPDKYVSLHDSNINHYVDVYEKEKWIIDKKEFIVK